LKAAQLVTDFAIQFHNVSVQLFQVQLEIKQVKLAAHRQQLEVVGTKLQEYGQKLAYADMSDKRNQIRLQKYNQELEGVKLFYAAQTALDEHTKLSIQLEELKLRESQDKVTTYSAIVKSRADEFDAYRSQWNAEEIKQNVFNQQLKGHDQEIETITKQEKLKQERFQAEAEIIRLARDKQALLLDHYAAKLQESTFAENKRSTMYQEEFNVYKNERAVADRYNEFANQRNVESANKILEATQTNINQMNVAVKAFLDAKDLNKAAAESALALYGAAVAKAEDSFLAIGTVADTTV
jgi:hypothetical protein